MSIIERLSRGIKGHEERVRRREEYGIRGIFKAVDIITFGKYAKYYIQAVEEAREETTEMMREAFRPFSQQQRRTPPEA